MRRRYLLFGAMAAVALAWRAATRYRPARPRPLPDGGGSTPTGRSNLKVTAPPREPGNGARSTTRRLPWWCRPRPASRDGAGPAPPSRCATKQTPRRQPAPAATSLTLPSLDPNRTYRWRVRGEIADGFGPGRRVDVQDARQAPVVYPRQRGLRCADGGNHCGHGVGPVQWIPGGREADGLHEPDHLPAARDATGRRVSMLSPA